MSPGTTGAPGSDWAVRSFSDLFLHRFIEGCFMVFESFLDDFVDDFTMFFASLFRDLFSCFFEIFRIDV